MRLFPLCSLLFLLGTRAHAGETLTFDSAAGWATWEAPYGLVQVGGQGELRLVKFRKDINAVADAPLFAHSTSTRGEAVAGGIWEAGSGRSTAGRIIDGDGETFWKPDPGDVVGEWFVQIDLGRAVLVREVRLRFPDREGARPFRQFTLFAATGATSDPKEDQFIFEPVFRTTRPNAATEISIPLKFAAQDSARVLDLDLEVDAAQKNHFRLVQYLNFTVEERDPEGALAEIEVVGVGDNVSIGTQRRGFVLDGLTARGNANLFDANMNTNNAIAPVTFGGRADTWQTQGTWFYADLGAVFWIDDLFIYALREQEGTAGFIASPPRGFTLLSSDGTRSIGTRLPVPEPLDFAELLTQPDPEPNSLRYLRYQFRPRRMRYLFWHVLDTQGWNSKWTELMLFSPGYPAQVVLRSDFINLGEAAGDGRPKVIRGLSWDADLPPGTRVQLRSRSGNALNEIYTFYDRKGEEVTEAKWNSSPKVLRGQVDTSVVVGEDWDAWSEEYERSGEAFKSQSPRRFVQLEMILSTNDPGTAPAVRSLSIEFEDALLQEARGSIWPRSVRANEDTRFTYRLHARADEGDSGFDLMRFILDRPVDAGSVEIEVGDRAVQPAWVEMRGDSLFIALAEPVRGDSLRASFTTRVLHNATVFDLDLGSSDRPGLWQSVEAAERRATIVMLPELPQSARLIGDLQVPAAFTPNGDGINDELEVRFVAFKVEGSQPEVSVYDLSGRRIAALARAPSVAPLRFTWSGRDAGGALVEPGLYILRIDLGAEAGEGTALRPVAVAY